MNARYLAPMLATACLLGASRAAAQGFPFEDAFTAYPPGTAGGPAWSILDGSFTTTDGALQGPVTIRYNARMPVRFTVDLTLDLRARPGARATVFFNHQHDAQTRSSDGVSVRLDERQSDNLHVETFVNGPSGRTSGKKVEVNLSEPSALRLKVVVDSGLGRFAVLAGDRKVVTSEPMEYPGGLLTITLEDGVHLDRFLLRTPETAESGSLAVNRLFNDPRDVAEDGEGLLVLHRGSPALLAVTIDGEVVRSFGRRAAGGVPDPVAMERGTKGEVMVLNRFPGEIVVFERNGGIRSRFGRGHLAEPSDLAVARDGTVYVADPGAPAIVAFAPDGSHVGKVAMPEGITGHPVRLAVDPYANLVIAFRGPSRVAVVRPTPDRRSSALVSVAEAEVSGIVALEGRTLAYSGDGVSVWPAAADAPVFRAHAVGGLKPGGRLGLAGGAVWAVDTGNSRMVRVPPSHQDSRPEVQFLNISQSSAVVRWTSEEPDDSASVRVTWGGVSTTETVRHKEPTTRHEVPLNGLRAPSETTLAVSPALRTIPPAAWSVEYPLVSPDPAPPAPEAADSQISGKAGQAP